MLFHAAYSRMLFIKEEDLAMIIDNLQRLKWGFFFIMIGLRIEGFDVFPDILGHIFFAISLSNLRQSSNYFGKAFIFNLPLIFISIFTIYQDPAQQDVSNLNLLGVLILIASFILNLMTVYNLFMGMKELEEGYGNTELASESERMWKNYLLLEIAMILSFLIIFVPVFGFLYIIGVLIAAIAVLIGIIKFLRRCIDSINPAA